MSANTDDAGNGSQPAGRPDSDKGAAWRVRPATSDRPSGESWVWVTGLGLTAGLVMVVLLLGLVVYEGVAVFWPKRVELITLHPEKGAAADSGARLAGEIVQSRTRRDLTRGRDVRELQMFVGNREAYAQSMNFRWVDEDSIAAREQPADIVVVERLAGGDAFGFPVEVRLAAGGKKETIAASDPRFFGELDKLIAAAVMVQANMDQVRRDHLNPLNRRIKAEEMSVRRAKEDNDAATVAALEASLAADNKAVVGHEAKLAEIAGGLTGNALVIRRAEGGKTEIRAADLVDWHRPNDAGVVGRTWHFLGNMGNFMWQNPRDANTEGGIFPAIVSTFFLTLLMSVAVVPFGVLAAIYLREYAKQGLFVRAVRIAVNNLAGVPSIVFGVFGFGFFVYFVGGGIDRWFFSDRLAINEPTFGTGGVLWAAFTLALMTVPVVIVATEEAIAAVPRGMREGSLATGASKWQTMQRIVLPASAPGILTGMILAMARGAGEVAPLMLVGVIKLAELPLGGVWKDTDLIPFVHLDQKFMHLGFHIYDLGFQSPDSEAAKPMVFATTLFLIGLVVLLNLGAIRIRERLRRKYQTSAF